MHGERAAGLGLGWSGLVLTSMEAAYVVMSHAFMSHRQAGSSPAATAAGSPK